MNKALAAAPRPGLRLRAPVPLAALLALWLGACAGLPAPVNAERSYAGRFSLAVSHAAPGPGQREAWTGRFSLAVAAKSVTLDLVSPVGTTLARFETDPLEARLLVPADGGLRLVRGADPQALSEQVLGWSLPIAGIADWVEGRPAAGRPFRPLPDPSGSDRFEQDGWAVTVEAPEGDRAGRRLQMDRPEKDGSPAVALRVVLDAPGS